jgi:hypothetical protein
MVIIIYFYINSSLSDMYNLHIKKPINTFNQI